jgi:hypothetical protein
MCALFMLGDSCAFCAVRNDGKTAASDTWPVGTSYAEEVPVSRLAALLAGLAVTALVLGLLLQAANGPLPPLTNESWVLIPLAIGLPLVGATIARRQPHHPIAWIFIGSGLGAGLASFSYEYGHYALVTRPGSVPLGVAMAWVSLWMWTTGAIPLLTFGLLLFPDGHLPSRRWRPIAWLAGATLAMFTVGSAVQPGPMPGYGDVPNPVGIEAARLLGVLATLSQLCLPVVVVGSAASILVRFRRARGLERQQLKWLTYAVTVATLALLLTSRQWAGWALAEIVTLFAVGFIPVAIGIAILRYRLYDIDRLISRTLVYGLLTALLAGVYATGVFVVGRLLDPATGESSLAVAASTLAVAALFQPLRRRIQRLVDRRFNRSRYDAARIVETFSGRLRDEIDLDSLSAELLAVVDQTMQPAQASLWLRPIGARAPVVQQGK